MPLVVQQRIHLYFSKMLYNMGHFPIAIGGIDNHIHILVDYNPAQPIPDMVRELKTASTKMINSNQCIPFLFGWQRGYSCFSHSPSQIAVVKKYIEHQAEHHKKMTLREEIIKSYERSGIKFDEQYIFEDFSLTKGQPHSGV